MRFFPFGDDVAAIGALAGHGGIFGIVGRRRQEIRAPAAKDEVEARSDLALDQLARDVDTAFGLRCRGEVAVGFPVALRAMFAGRRGSPLRDSGGRDAPRRALRRPPFWERV